VKEACRYRGGSGGRTAEVKRYGGYSTYMRTGGPEKMTRHEALLGGSKPMLSAMEEV